MAVLEVLSYDDPLVSNSLEMGETSTNSLQVGSCSCYYSGPYCSSTCTMLQGGLAGRGTPASTIATVPNITSHVFVHCKSIQACLTS